MENTVFTTVSDLLDEFEKKREADNEKEQKEIEGLEKKVKKALESREKAKSALKAEEFQKADAEYKMYSEALETAQKKHNQAKSIEIPDNLATAKDTAIKETETAIKENTIKAIKLFRKIEALSNANNDLARNLNAILSECAEKCHLDWHDYHYNFRDEIKYYIIDHDDRGGWGSREGDFFRRYEE